MLGSMFGTALLPVLALSAIPSSSARTPYTPACNDGERERALCRTQKGVARFCQTDTGLSYRFGTLGAKPELDLDQTAVALRDTGPDAEQVAFWARNVVNDEGTWRYTVVIDRTEDQFDGRLLVSKNGKTVATIPCKGSVGADLTELEALEKAVGTAPRDLASWIGSWERLDEETKGDADLTLTPKGDGLAITGVSTLPIYETVHIAEFGGDEGAAVAKPTSEGLPTTLQLKAHCTVDLKWVGPGEILVTDSGDCGGHAVTFTGRYRRTFGS